MIKLTEVSKNSSGKLRELDVLVNPAEIVVIQSSDIIKEEHPIIGSNENHLMSIRIIQLTNGKFVTVSETVDEILDILEK